MAIFPPSSPREKREGPSHHFLRQMYGEAYLPFTCDHLPRVQSIVASSTASGSVIPVATPGSGPIRQVHLPLGRLPLKKSETMNSVYRGT